MDKFCPRCKDSLPLESFPRNRGKDDGRGTHCGDCNRAAQAEYRARVIARDKITPAEKLCVRCGAMKSSGCFANNVTRIDGLSGYCGDCQNAAVAVWKRNNPEVVARQNRLDAARFRRRDPEKKSAMDRRYRENNQDRIHANRWRRKAIKRGAFVERVHRSVVFKRCDGTCHMCGEKVDPNCWHLDHVLPLVRGGQHSYANTAVACPSCNMQRGSKTMDEWLASLPERASW